MSPYQRLSVDIPNAVGSCVTPAPLELTTGAFYADLAEGQPLFVDTIAIDLILAAEPPSPVAAQSHHPSSVNAFVLLEGLAVARIVMLGTVQQTPPAAFLHDLFSGWRGVVNLPRSVPIAARTQLSVRLGITSSDTTAGDTYTVALWPAPVPDVVPGYPESRLILAGELGAQPQRRL